MAGLRRSCAVGVSAMVRARVGLVGRATDAPQLQTRAEQPYWWCARLPARSTDGGSRSTQLETGVAVSVTSPAVTSEVVRRALADADALLKSDGGPTSAVDRLHTALHGHLIAVCSEAGIPHSATDSAAKLLKALRANHPRLRDLGPRSQDIEKILFSCANILDSLAPVRNQASVAHPNEALLSRDEALLVVNVSRTMLQYLDAKLA